MLPSPRPVDRTALPPLGRALAAACAALLALVMLAPAAGAQGRPPVVERAAAFDSAGRVLVLTPALVARLGLRAPAWPVSGPFAEARLYAVEGQGAVLHVARTSGVIERYPLEPAERDALVAAVSRGVAASATGVRSDTNTVVSEPAGNGFVRTQAIRGALVYGPAAAGLLSGNATAATLGYAAALGAAYATALGYSRSHPVTRAQAHLSGNMAYGGAAAAAAATALFEPSDGKAYAAAVLAGGVAGTVIGVRRAAGMTDAEATSSGGAAVASAALAVGVAGAVGAFDRDGTAKAATAAAIGALAGGYVAGPAYARQRRYVVTAGDAQLPLPAAAVGAAIAAGLATTGTDDGRVQAAAATAGGIAGLLVGDRALVRRFDFTTAESGLVRLGTLVGAGVGTALAASAKANDGGTLTAAGVGALGGLALTVAAGHPTPAGSAPRLRSSDARLRLSPLGAVLAASGARGRFPLGTATF